MSTLLDRAKSLMSSRSAHAAVLALTPLAAATANADAFDWTHNSTRLQYVQSGGGGGWVDYDVPTASVGSAYLPTNGIKLYGTGSDDGSVFSMTGAQYRRSFDDNLRGNRLIMSGTSTFDGAHWTHPTDYISTLFKYGITVTGGNVEMYSVETGFTLYDAANNFLIGVGSSTGGFNYTVGHTDTSFGFQDRFGSNFETGTHLDWTVAFYFDWTGVDQDDAIQFFIPNNSVDIQVVPAPAAAGLLGFAGLLGARRRRR